MNIFIGELYFDLQDVSGLKSNHVWPILEDYLSGGLKLEEYNSHLQILNFQKEIGGFNYEAVINDGRISLKVMIAPSKSNLGCGGK